jgi:hypothetical protein
MPNVLFGGLEASCVTLKSFKKVFRYKYITGTEKNFFIFIFGHQKTASEYESEKLIK